VLVFVVCGVAMVSGDVKCVVALGVRHELSPLEFAWKCQQCAIRIGCRFT
jgi:hypothetical protein